MKDLCALHGKVTIFGAHAILAIKPSWDALALNLTPLPIQAGIPQPYGQSVLGPRLHGLHAFYRVSACVARSGRLVIGPQLRALSFACLSNCSCFSFSPFVDWLRSRVTFPQNS